MMFKILPDAEIEWKDVWVGSAFTAVLFTISKLLLGLYFGNSDPASSYGAAGSIVLIMLWVSYTCLVIFFGAEFTQVYARRYGKRILPSSHAYHYKIVEETIEVGEQEGEKHCKDQLEPSEDC
jgi:membrane protein